MPPKKSKASSSSHLPAEGTVARTYTDKKLKNFTSCEGLRFLTLASIARHYGLGATDTSKGYCGKINVFLRKNPHLVKVYKERVRHAHAHKVHSKRKVVHAHKNSHAAVTLELERSLKELKEAQKKGTLSKAKLDEFKEKHSVRKEKHSKITEALAAANKDLAEAEKLHGSVIHDLTPVQERAHGDTLKDMRARLKKADDTIDELKKAEQRHLAQIKLLNESAFKGASKADINRLVDEQNVHLESVRGQSAALTDSRADLQAEYDRLLQRADVSTDQMLALRHEVELKNQEINKLIAITDEKVRIAEEKAGARPSAAQTQEIARLMTEEAALKAQRATLEREIVQERQTLTDEKLEAQEALNDARSRASAEINVLKEQNGAKDAEIARQGELRQGQVRSFQQQSEVKDGEISRLQRQLATQREESRKLNERLAFQEQNIADQIARHETIANTVSDLGRYRANAAAQNPKVRADTRQLGRLNESIDDLDADIDELKSGLRESKDFSEVVANQERKGEISEVNREDWEANMDATEAKYDALNVKLADVKDQAVQATHHLARDIGLDNGFFNHKEIVDILEEAEGEADLPPNEWTLENLPEPSGLTSFATAAANVVRRQLPLDTQGGQKTLCADFRYNPENAVSIIEKQSIKKIKDEIARCFQGLSRKQLNAVRVKRRNASTGRYDNVVPDKAWWVKYFTRSLGNQPIPLYNLSRDFSEPEDSEAVQEFNENADEEEEIPEEIEEEEEDQDADFF